MFSRKIRRVISILSVVIATGLCFYTEAGTVNANASSLPGGYEQLDYVEFSELNTSDGLTMEIPFSLSSNSDAYKWELVISNLERTQVRGSLVGIYDSNQRTGYLYAGYNSETMAIAIGGSTHYGQDPVTALSIIGRGDSKITIKADINGSTKHFSVHESLDNKTMENSFSGDFPLNQTFLLNGCCPTNQEFMKFKFYGVKIWDGSGNLKVNMVPAKDSEGVEGGYDTVSGNFYPKFKYGASKTISLDTQGGEGGTSSVSVTNGSDLSSIDELPVKESCYFNGYYSATGGKGTKYFDMDGNPVLKRAAFGESMDTLYAYWTSEKPAEPVKSSSEPDHVCNFEWRIIEEPTQDADGLEGEVCDVCGRIGRTLPISAYVYTLYDYATPLIDAAVAGQNVTFELGEWNSFPKSFMEKLAAKSAEGVSFVFHYNWNHELQTINIPAGTPINLEFAWFGPAKMAELYGMY